MNRLATIISLADRTQGMSDDERYRFITRVLRSVPDCDLMTIELELDVEAAKKVA